MAEAAAAVCAKGENSCGFFMAEKIWTDSKRMKWKAFCHLNVFSLSLQLCALTSIEEKSVKKRGKTDYHWREERKSSTFLSIQYFFNIKTTKSEKSMGFFSSCQRQSEHPIRDGSWNFMCICFQVYIQWKTFPIVSVVHVVYHHLWQSDTTTCSCIFLF